MQSKRFTTWLVFVVALILTACGGGASTPVVKVTGVAATGAAIAKGTVTLKCALGATYTTTTGTDGKFSVNVSGIGLPCLAQVDYIDGTGAAKSLRSVVTSAGNVNITPITELVVANLVGGSAADAFNNFDAAAVRGYTAAGVAAAVSAVRNYLSTTLAVDVTALPADPIAAAFVAAANGGSGDAVDAILDALQTKFTPTFKLEDAVTAVGAITPPSSGGGSSATPDTPGTMTVTAASLSTRNGSYAITGATFTSGSDSGFNGNTADGNFEMEVVWASNATIKRAHVWFFGTGGSIKYFGCDGSGISCAGVAYEPLLKQVWFTNVAWTEVTPDLTGATPDVAVPSGETLTLNATISAP